MAQRVSAPASGLAYRHDFNADMQRTAQIEAVREHKKQENLKTSQYLAEQMQTTTVQGPARVKEYEDHIMKVNDQVADFFINNRDFMSDPGKFAEFKNIAKQYIDNPIVERDLNVEKHHQMFQQAAASGQLKQSEIDAFATQYDEYLNNPDAEPFAFVMPKRQSIMEIAEEGAGMIGMFRGNYITKDGVQVDYNKANQLSADRAVDSIFQDEDKRMVAMNTYNEMKIGETGVSPEKWMKDWIISMKDASEVKNYAYSNYNPNNTSGSGGDQGINYFQEQIWGKGAEKAILNGMDYESDTDPNLVYFSKNGKTGEFIAGPDDELFYTDSEGNFALDESSQSSRNVNEPYQNSAQKRRKMNLLGTSASGKINNANQMKIIGGVPYIVLEMEIGVDASKTDLAESLKANGFTEVSKPSGSGEIINFGGAEETTTKYVGKVLQKANINPVSIHKYNSELNSAKGKENLQQYRTIDEAMSVITQRATTVRENPDWRFDKQKGFFYNDATGEAMSEDYKHVWSSKD